jgi:3-oxoacyl-[acyl-carrier-protein] synthase II
MGAVTPLGVGVPAFARGLRQGRSGTRLIPWRDPRVNSRVAATCPDFDPAAILSHADLARFPKLIPMALAAAREACAQAGLLVAGESPILNDAVIDPREVAVILGTGAGGIDFTLDQADAGHNGRRISLWTITNATHGNLAGELSIRLGAKGPSLCVSTGCASASDAVGMGRDLLMSSRPGAPRVVVVVGSDAHVRWETIAGMELLGVISTRGAETEDAAATASRPFCTSRDGFILGEGAWAVVLERDDARQRDALGRRGRAIARVRGYGVTCDAFHRVRPDPDMTESIHAMRLAMTDAQIEPKDVGVVHYHGTATQLNDALETRAVRGALGEHAANVPGHSVKSMIGHPQGASGLASLVSTLAGLTGADGGSPFLLPTINLHEPDPACDLDYTAHGSRPADPARHKIALINCLAFGAKNSALVVEVA